VSADDPVAAALADTRPAVRTFGSREGAHYRIVDEQTGPAGCRFTLSVDGVALGEITVPLGVKVAANAAAATAIALELGVEFAAAVRALATFGGVARRFEYRGERDGVAFVDDYAHLPGEVTAAIAAARQGRWKRVVAVFQPHRYTRTSALWRDFADAFTDADVVVLTDVYAAGETPIAGVTGRLIVHAVLDAHPAQPLAYLPRRPDLVDVPRRWARTGDVVLTLGAGDLTTMPDVWLGHEAGADA
jgi:UDP-N-acetylmuramate--alanine ligase